MYQIGVDTDSKAYERFEKMFSGAYGSKSVKIGRIVDLANLLRNQEVTLDSEEEREQSLRFRKFDRKMISGGKLKSSSRVMSRDELDTVDAKRGN